jgi:sulfonate transport system ATP-binding protein
LNILSPRWAVALADRVLVLEQGGIAHDIDVEIARPRQHGSAQAGGLEGSILRELLRGGHRKEE